jgi:hypothetical protein
VVAVQAARGAFERGSLKLAAQIVDESPRRPFSKPQLSMIMFLGLGKQPLSTSQQLIKCEDLRLVEVPAVELE